MAFSPRGVTKSVIFRDFFKVAPNEIMFAGHLVVARAPSMRLEGAFRLANSRLAIARDESSRLGARRTPRERGATADDLSATLPVLCCGASGAGAPCASASTRGKAARIGLDWSAKSTHVYSPDKFSNRILMSKSMENRMLYR